MSGPERFTWIRSGGKRSRDADGCSIGAMKQPDTFSSARREFLRFLAASPYVAALGGVATFLEVRSFGQSAPSASDVIANPADALSVLDFEEAPHRKVMPGHSAY